MHIRAPRRAVARAPPCLSRPGGQRRLAVVDGTFIWTPSHDQRPCSVSAALLRGCDPCRPGTAVQVERPQQSEDEGLDGRRPARPHGDGRSCGPARQTLSRTKPLTPQPQPQYLSGRSTLKWPRCSLVGPHQVDKANLSDLVHLNLLECHRCLLGSADRSGSGSTGSGAPLLIGFRWSHAPGGDMTATVTATAAAANGKRHRSAAPKEARTSCNNLGYARPEKRTVGIDADKCSDCCQSPRQCLTYIQLWSVGPVHGSQRTALDDAPAPIVQKVTRRLHH